MNIQPLGSPAAPKLDERLPGAAEPHATAGATAVKTTGPQAAPAATGDPSRDQVDAAVKKLNDAMSASAQSLEFSVDHDSKQIVVKLIDQGTKEVLRQIPSVEALEMAKSIDKMQGRLIHQTA